MIQDVFRYKSLSQEQLLFDLKWLLGAKSLLRTDLPGFKGEIILGFSDLLSQKELSDCYEEQLNDPSKILSYFLIDEQLIVGKYFEKLIAFIFFQLPRFNVLHYSKQLFDKKQTIGELDFIIKDLSSHAIMHIEVAIKFYMGFKNSGKHDLWIGPNGMDTLKKKMAKLQDQLELSDQLELAIPDKRILLLGYFFKHWKNSNWPYFSLISNDERVWLYEDEMEAYFDLKSFYLIMPKYKWVGFYIDKEGAFLGGAEVIREVKSQLHIIGKGIMLVQLNEFKRKVIRKIIVVPAKWPKL